MQKSTNYTNLHTLPASMQKLADGRHHDPHQILGAHQNGASCTLRVYAPHAQSVSVVNPAATLTRIKQSDFFELTTDQASLPRHYELEYELPSGERYCAFDPYSFEPSINDFDLHLFGEGRHHHIYRLLGAQPMEIDGISGVRFATWGPNAERISVVGDFNGWDGRRHPMMSRGASGVWELFVPGLHAGDLYKFEIRSRWNDVVFTKTDPYGMAFEQRPKTAAIVTSPPTFGWTDESWMAQRPNFDWQHQPMSVYEVHLGSWQRDPGGEFLSYRELANALIPYVAEMGFTHIELLPITEHPLDASWGYQTTGYFAPTSRFGSPDDFRYFVNACHERGIGVILDWVPAHFPKDGHGIARFDGTALYEHEDPRKGEHRDWGTLIYNFGRNEVKNFLISSAVCWLEEFHIDGLRVDAVASMLYLDYSREDGEWEPNQFGGNENLEAIAFLKHLNEVTHELQPGTVVIAEESTAWPQVTRPTWLGGLGFSMKWNMGWMHDTLSYLSNDPVHRRFHHDQLTFGLLYAFTENFVLPFSHDEVVHGKSSMLNKMPGDEWQKFASLRLLYTYMFTYPGKKLLFMGCEFGQGTEWNCDTSLDWYVLDYPLHQGLQQLVKDLNALYQQHPALHAQDFHGDGFEWIDCHDSDQSVLCYQRKSADTNLVMLLNFTPVPRRNYRIGVPAAGRYHTRLNSDSEFYGGSNVGQDYVDTEPVRWMNHAQSMRIDLPPLGAVVFELF